MGGDWGQRIELTSIPRKRIIIDEANNDNKHRPEYPT